jgi:hemoglobin
MQAWFDRVRSMPLPVQPSLDHRGVFGSGDASLFPPTGTFEALGGREAVGRLVDGLYDRIEADPVLRPAFNRDLTPEREKLKLWFEAWSGGDPTYFDAEWRQGLKVTHRKITISRGMVDRWAGHFRDALAETVQDPTIVRRITPSISRLAMALVNSADEPVPGARLRRISSGADLQPFLRLVQRDAAQELAAVAAGHPQVLLRYGPMLLLLAAVRGKAQASQELLRQGVAVNAPALLPGSEASASRLPMLQLTPLCGALAKCREAVVRLLIQHGAQYDIFTASCIGDLDAVQELLDVAPDLANARDPASDVAPITPLMHAVCAGQLEVARLLLQRGATVGVNSVRLVRVAANGGHAALTDLLVEHGADVAAIGSGAWVLYPAIAAKLRARGADVNQPPGAWIGMCCTGNSGHTEKAALARAMLENGADVAARYGGRTALHCAAKAGFVQVVEALIEHGGDVNARNDHGQTPLDEVEHAASSIDREPVRRLLIAHGARRSKHEAVPNDDENMRNC